MWPVQGKMIEVVKRIPKGYVTNYGTIAAIVQEELDRRITPRIIGRQLSGLPVDEWSLLPRRRVIAKNGFVSTLKLGDKWWKQIQLLEKEWIQVKDNAVDMEIYAADISILSPIG